MSRTKPKPERVTLHDEVITILKASGKPMTTTALAANVIERGRYRRRDGKPYQPGELWPYSIWQLAERSPDLNRKATTVTLVRRRRAAREAS